MHACAWMCERGDGFLGKNVRKMKFQQQQQQQQQQHHHVTIEKTTSPRVEKGIELFFDLKFSFVWVSFRCMCEKIRFQLSAHAAPQKTRHTPTQQTGTRPQKKEFLN